jgi:hypothetical protein
MFVFVQSRLYNESLQFNAESIFIFTLSSTGDDVRITAIEEFIDTKLAADFAAAAAAPASSGPAPTQK